MWTPRRVGLLLLGLAGCVTAYLVYAFLLGGIDGLPQLPERFRVEGVGPAVVTPSVSPTVVSLATAFGPDSPEVTDTTNYTTRVQDTSRGLLIASGPPTPDGSKFVAVDHLSVAVVGKRPPGASADEVADVSTLHADKARLEFDRPVARIEEMYDKAKVVGIELISDPDVPTAASPKAGRRDERKGRIWLTNNQKSADPADHVVVRTVGPLFYRMPDDATPPPPDVPQVWTTALVEVFDRRNLPRPVRSRAPGLSTIGAVNEVIGGIPPVAALARADDLRRPGAVADILDGRSLPPPTVTATGLNLFFRSEKAQPGQPSRQKGGGTISGAREVVLLANVQMNLWADGDSGLPGGGDGPKPDAKRAAPAAPNADPPLAALAVCGGTVDPATTARRKGSRALLMIETPGPFKYDFEKKTARFEIAPTPPADQRPNYVIATRVSGKDVQDNLFCTDLQIDFGDPPVPVAANGKPAPAPAPNGDGGTAVRQLTATGPNVFVSVQAEGLEASGTKLTYTRAASGGGSVVTLRGSPVIAKQNEHKMQGGDAATPGEVVIVTADPGPNDPAGQKQTTVGVNGPGTIQLFETETDPQGRTRKKMTASAGWRNSLTHEKVRDGKQVVDLLKFDGDGVFVDPASDFRLEARKLWLWVAPRKPDPAAPPPSKTPASSSVQTMAAVPERLLADGDVKSNSPDLMVKDTDKLTVWFRDVPPPKLPPPTTGTVVATAPPKPFVGPMPPVTAPPAMPPTAVATKSATPEPAKKANPIHLSARVIETWVVRYPLATEVAAKPTAGTASAAVPGAAASKDVAARNGPGSLRYELERARCEDRVVVHQDPDPTDPNHPPTGLDITASRTLTLDQSSAGGVLTVVGTDTDPAAVTFETTTVYGQTVVINQPNNSVDVDGAGRLVMTTGTDMSGKPLSSPSRLEVNWSRLMSFEGGRSKARFVGGVTATQIVRPDPPAQPGSVTVAARPPERPAERLPLPQPVGDANPYTTRSTLQSHQLDLTFDRPVYFNQLRTADRSRTPPPAGQAATGADRPQLKAAVAVPVPEDERAKAGGAAVRDVYLWEETFAPDPAAKDPKTAPLVYVRARRLRAKQIDFTNREKEQELLATGEGEMRLLQADGKDDPAPAVTPATAPPPPGDMKLTVVNFPKRMVAKDLPAGYQEARFEDGATVVSVPTADLMLAVEPHALPKKATYLECDREMVVSSSTAKKGAAPDQRLTATGNAKFVDDTYTGLGGKVTYDGKRVILDAAGANRLATLSRNAVGLNREDAQRAQQFVYTKDGSVTVNGSAGATFGSGGK